MDIYEGRKAGRKACFSSRKLTFLTFTVALHTVGEERTEWLHGGLRPLKYCFAILMDRDGVRWGVNARKGAAGSHWSGHSGKLYDLFFIGNMTTIGEGIFDKPGDWEVFFFFPAFGRAEGSQCKTKLAVLGIPSFFFIIHAVGEANYLARSSRLSCFLFYVAGGGGGGV